MDNIKYMVAIFPSIVLIILGICIKYYKMCKRWNTHRTREKQLRKAIARAVFNKILLWQFSLCSCIASVSVF